MKEDKGKGNGCNTQRNKNTDGEKETTIKVNTRMRYRDTRSIATGYVQEFRIFVRTSKPRRTRARLGNAKLADEAELVSLAVG